MNYLTATPEQQAKIREWIKANEPELYDLASYYRQLFDAKLLEIVKPEEELTCL